MGSNSFLGLMGIPSIEPVLGSENMSELMVS